MTEKQHQPKKKYYYRCPCGGPIHLMNEYPQEGYEYQPTLVEEIANVLTHGIPALLSVLAIWYMMNNVVNTKREAISASIYGGCCVLLFTVSSTYHLTAIIFGKSSAINKIFQKFDHSLIFTFIAASYTPWLLLIDVGEQNRFGKAIFTFIWCFAIVGTMKSTIKGFLPNLSSLVLYLTMGWASIIYVALFLYMIYAGRLQTELALLHSISEIAIGGLLYSFGAYVFGLDGKLPLAHAIWHLFVAAAAACHMHAVHVYLMALE